MTENGQRVWLTNPYTIAKDSCSEAQRANHRHGRPPSPVHFGYWGLYDVESVSRSASRDSWSGCYFQVSDFIHESCAHQRKCLTVALSFLEQTFAVGLDCPHRHCLCAWGATEPLFAQVAAISLRTRRTGSGPVSAYGDRHPPLIVLVVNGQSFLSVMR